MLESPNARERLLDCAEHLFGERGVGGVSLRAINAGAGLSPAALHYHFGSKRALIEALLERRMSQVRVRRQALLEALASASDPPTAREVLDALIRPLAELIAREGEAGRRYLRLLTRLHGDGDLDEAFVVARSEGTLATLEPLMQRALPAVPPGVVRHRLAFAIEPMLPALANWNTPIGASYQGRGPEDFEAVVATLTDFLVGGFEAPVGAADHDDWSLARDADTSHRTRNDSRGEQA